MMLSTLAPNMTHIGVTVSVVPSLNCLNELNNMVKITEKSCNM